MISRRVEYDIVCDVCGGDYNWRQFDSARDAVRTVEDEGWLSSGPLGRRLVCPDCRSDECK